jgi:hypothetical protein
VVLVGPSVEKRIERRTVRPRPPAADTSVDGS